MREAFKTRGEESIFVHMMMVMKEERLDSLEDQGQGE
jgi:hypothetical protein